VHGWRFQTGPPQPWRAPLLLSSFRARAHRQQASALLLRGQGHSRGAGTRRPYCELRRTATPRRGAPKGLLRLFLTTLVTRRASVRTRARHRFLGLAR
jgi:hypothetical protein